MRRRGPGLIRTAAVVGTATVVSKGVSGAMDQRTAQQQAAQQQQQQADYNAGAQAQQDAYAQQQQMAAAQAAAAQPAPTQAASPGAITDDTIAQLQKLAELQKQGILTPEEFAQQKARILGS
jgi:lipoprotein-anchoring transpeptidase ErfK/SrfK